MADGENYTGDGVDREPRAVMKYSGDAESVEWFNMAWRKVHSSSFSHAR